LRTLLSLFLALVFFSSFLAVQAFSGPKNKLSDEKFYRLHFEDVDLYQRVHSDVLVKVNEARQLFAGLQLSDTEAADLLKKIISPADMREQTERVIGNFLQWFRNEVNAPEPDVAVDLRPFKVKALREVPLFVSMKLKTLQTCAPGQDPGVSATSFSIPKCVPQGIPPEQAKAQFLAQLDVELNKSLAGVRDSLDLIGLAVESSSTSRADFVKQLDDARAWNGRASLVFILSIIAILLSAGLILLVNKGSSRRMLMWLGGTAVFSGLVVLIASLVARSQLVSRLHDEIIQHSGRLPGSATLLFSDLTDSAVPDLMNGFVLPSVLLLALGLAIMLGGALWGSGGGKAGKSKRAARE